MMQRREFLAAGAAAAVGLAASKVALSADAPSAGGRQIFELRTYHFASPEKREKFEQFLAKAAIPALNRAGIEPVGVWKSPGKEINGKGPEPDTDLYVFLPHPSLESVLTLEGRLAADKAFQEAGRDVLDASKSDPAFKRYETSLLHAFEGFPRVRPGAKNPSRVVELRTYESHNAERAANKVEMFNKGEFPIFDRAGMPGLFFGSAFAGPDLPQLTYMIVHPSEAEVKKNWDAFMNDKEWKPLISNPAYKDNVSNIIDKFLVPTAGSQL